MAQRGDELVLYGADNRPLEKAQYDLRGNLTTSIAPFEGPTLRINRATPKGASPRLDLSPMLALQQINPNLWPFDPGIPLMPITAGGGGIRWAPVAGYNVTYSPDKKIGIANSKLRAFADACPGIRIIIEQLKREFIGLEKDILPRDTKDEDLEKSPEREKLRDFLVCPDPDQDLDLQQWEMQVLEDLLVIGAPAIWRMHNHGGEFAGLRPIDAALIAPYVTARGTQPKPPARAYSFSAYSLPYIAYTTDELIYKPMESRTWTPYGFGPVESTIAYVLVQIYRSLYYVNTYDRSDLPPGWITLPKDWTQKNVVDFADAMALRFEGEQPERYHVRYMPAESKYQQAKQMPDWNYSFDEYLMRVFAWRVGVSASPIVKTTSLGKGSEGLQQEALAGGLRPIIKYIKRIFDKTLWDDQTGLTTEGEEFPRGFGNKDYEWQVTEEREENKQLKLTENKDLQENGAKTANEVRKDYGLELLDPDEYPAADEPMFKLPTGWVPLKSIQVLSPEEQAAKDAEAAKAVAAARAAALPPRGASPEGGTEPGVEAGQGGARGGSEPGKSGAKPGVPPVRGGAKGKVPPQLVAAGAAKLAKARSRLQADIADESSETGVEQDRTAHMFEDYVVGWLKSPDPEWRVALLDGKAYRRDVDIDFLGATNPYAPTGENFLPAGVIAIDNRLAPDEWPFFVDHELREARDMAAGEDYQPSHEDANAAELADRLAGKASMRSDLRKWQRKAKADLRAGRKPRPFVSEAIPAATRFWIEKSLVEGDLAKAFRKPMGAKTSATSERTVHHRMKMALWWEPRLKRFARHFSEIAIARLGHAQKVVGGPAVDEFQKEKLNQILKAEDGGWPDPEVTPSEYGELVTVIEGMYEAGVADSVEIVGGGQVSAAEYARERAAQLIGKRWDPETGSWIENPDQRYVISDTVRQQVQDRLAAAIESGEDAAGFRDGLDELFGSDIPSRASMIARTECLTGDTLVSAAVVRAVTRRWYEGAVIEIRTANGRQFTTTPNHPMLTRRGWLKAKEIAPGDDLICDVRQQDAGAPGDKNIEATPATIAEIFDSLSTIGIPERRTGAEPDFHGDGRQGDVDVLTPHGELRIGSFTALYKPTIDKILSEADLARASFCDRCEKLLSLDKQVCLCDRTEPNISVPQPLVDDPDANAEGAGDALGRLPPEIAADDLPSGQVWDVSGVRPAARIEGIPSVGEAPGNAGPADEGGDAIIGNPCTPRNLTGAQPSQIEFDQVISITNKQFAGHVFNLSTPDGYFAINGVYTGNTREAYNSGAIDNFASMGVEQVEIMDGSGLGDVCDEENGDIVDIDEFLAISADRHPNCTIAPAPVLMGEEEGDVLIVKGAAAPLAMLSEAGGPLPAVSIQAKRALRAAENKRVLSGPVIYGVRAQRAVRKEYDESQHPRAEAGSPEGGQWISGGGTTSQVLADISGDKNHYNYYGMRVMARNSEPVKVGDTLGPSYQNLDEQDEESENLGGTSAIGIDDVSSEEDVSRAISATNSYSGNVVVLLGSHTKDYGNDPGEIVMHNAEVIAVYSKGALRAAEEGE